MLGVAVATALGMKSMARDFGLEVKLQLETDSVAGRGMALRLGAGKVRHIETSGFGSRASSIDARPYARKSRA